MKTFKTLALAAALSAAGLAHANTQHYSAGFTLSDTPNLRVGSPAFDDTRVTVGEWTTQNKTQTNVDLRPLDGAWQHADNMRKAGGPPLGLGQNVANVGLVPGVFGQAEVNMKSISASLDVTDAAAVEGKAMSQWSRNFKLDPKSSLTIAGVMNLNLGGVTTPINHTYTNPNSLAGIGDFVLEDANHEVGLRFSSSLADYKGDRSHIFSHTTDAAGVTYLTINNDSITPIFGSVSIDAWANISSAVPEPAAYLSMMLGLGLVGAIARRKKSNR